MINWKARFCRFRDAVMNLEELGEGFCALARATFRLDWLADSALAGGHYIEFSVPAADIHDFSFGLQGGADGIASVRFAPGRGAVQEVCPVQVATSSLLSTLKASVRQALPADQPQPQLVLDANLAAAVEAGYSLDLATVIHGAAPQEDLLRGDAAREEAEQCWTCGLYLCRERVAFFRRRVCPPSACSLPLPWETTGLMEGLGWAGSYPLSLHISSSRPGIGKRVAVTRVSHHPPYCPESVSAQPIIQ